MCCLRYVTAFAPLALILVAMSLLSGTSPAARENALVVPIELVPKGAATPEVAATSLFRGTATRSPRHFSQHLLLGVCDGPVSTLNKYAEALHTTAYSDGEHALTVYELPKMMKRETERVVAIQEFDSEDKDVVALQSQMMSTYYGEEFKCVEVAAEDYNGREYRARVVVAMVNDRWYAMPRCRSSKSFYQIADAMILKASEADDAG